MEDMNPTPETDSFREESAQAMGESSPARASAEFFGDQGVEAEGRIGSAFPRTREALPEAGKTDEADAPLARMEAFEALTVEAPEDAPSILPENPKEIKRILEALLLSARQPLTAAEIRKAFANAISADTLRVLLDELRAEYAERPLELLQIAGGWRFRTKTEYTPYIARLDPEKTLRYSRAVLETLAIIAYRQPVTRGDIEDIRGISVSSQILRALEERGWIETVGHRDKPGHPALLATTEKFLDDIGLLSLSELPPLGSFDQALHQELEFADATQNA
jgi:segregation and condensation protein B